MYKESDMGNMELTEYEDNILTMYAMGATKKEISKAMGISKYMLNKFSKDIL